jgi:Right handed beta helix region
VLRREESSTFDRARDGVIRGNTVWNCTSTSNPAYRNTPGAGGIYVDGGTRILIEQNISYENDIGLEIASEHPGKASDFVIARNNLIFRNRVGGIFMGGYDIKRGRSENNTVRNNTLWENDTFNDGNGEIYLQHRVKNNVITQNIIVAGEQSLMLVNPRTSNSGNVLDYNLWFAPAGASEARWKWKGKNKKGFDAWQIASKAEVNSFFADPLFVNTSA